MMATAKLRTDRLSAMLAIAEHEQNTFDAERLAAINAVEKLLKKSGLRLRDLAVPGPPAEHREPLVRKWRETCRRLMERINDLRPWERGFVADLPKFQRISSKQRYILNEIAERLGCKP